MKMKTLGVLVFGMIAFVIPATVGMKANASDGPGGPILIPMNPLTGMGFIGGEESMAKYGIGSGPRRGLKFLISSAAGTGDLDVKEILPWTGGYEEIINHRVWKSWTNGNYTLAVDEQILVRHKAVGDSVTNKFVPHNGLFQARPGIREKGVTLKKTQDFLLVERLNPGILRVNNEVFRSGLKIFLHMSEDDGGEFVSEEGVGPSAIAEISLSLAVQNRMSQRTIHNFKVRGLTYKAVTQ